MADQMKATPRSPILGLFSDIVNLPLQYMSAPERTQQMQGVAQFLYGTGIPKTLERASYGDSLFSGAGMTLRPKEETINAAMNVAPFAPAVGRLASRAVKATEGMPVGMGIKDVGKSSFEYMASHRPVTIEGGASTLDNLIPSFGEDIYGKNALQYFGTGSPNLDRQALSVFQQVKGNPNATVTVYRAVPKNVEQQSLNSGDWVTISRDYARQHGESTLGGNYKLVEQQVPVSSLTTNADSILEQGYYPKTPVETPPTFTDPFGNTIGSSIR